MFTPDGNVLPCTDKATVMEKIEDMISAKNDGTKKEESSDLADQECKVSEMTF